MHCDHSGNSRCKPRIIRRYKYAQSIPVAFSRASFRNSANATLLTKWPPRPSGRSFDGRWYVRQCRRRGRSPRRYIKGRHTRSRSCAWLLHPLFHHGLPLFRLAVVTLVVMRRTRRRRTLITRGRVNGTAAYLKVRKLSTVACRRWCCEGWTCAFLMR